MSIALIFPSWGNLRDDIDTHSIGLGVIIFTNLMQYGFLLMQTFSSKQLATDTHSSPVRKIYIVVFLVSTVSDLSVSFILTVMFAIPCGTELLCYGTWQYRMFFTHNNYCNTRHGGSWFRLRSWSLPKISQKSHIPLAPVLGHCLNCHKVHIPLGSIIGHRQKCHKHQTSHSCASFFGHCLKYRKHRTNDVT